MGREPPYASVRVGGVVDGEQYFIVGVRDETDEYLSAPLTESEVRELSRDIHKCIDAAETDTDAEE